ncbi:Bromodomain-containing protein 4 [Pseudocyphellaria aurata]|nr:Bromodomain-containing protein 4 [Pseudocyphellaria aurata]
MVNAPMAKVHMPHAPMAQPQPPAPHGRPHPGLAEEFRRLNINLPHMQQPGQPGQPGQQGQQAFARREGTPSPPKLVGFLLTKTKDPGIPETWERIQKKELAVTQDELSDEINKEKKRGVSVMAKYEHQDMDGFKRSQVDRLIKDLTLGDPGYDYKLVLLKLREGRTAKGQRMTVSMRVILRGQLATGNPRTRMQGLDSQTVDINQSPPGPTFIPMPPANRFPQQPPPPPPPQPAPRDPQPFNFDPWSFPNERPGVNIPRRPPTPGTGFNAHHDRPSHTPEVFTPPSGESSPRSDRSSPPLDFSRPFVPNRPSHPGRPEEDRREPKQSHNVPLPRQPSHGNFFLRPDFLPGGRPDEQAKKSKTKDDRPKASEQKKGNQAKKEKKDHLPFFDPLDSDFSDAMLSDDSGFSRTGTNRTGDTEVSDHRRDKRFSTGHRDGYRSAYGSLEEDHDDDVRGNRRDHGDKRFSTGHRDGHRSAHGSLEEDHDDDIRGYRRDHAARRRDSLGFRQHRRKSPLHSANSSISSGSRYLYDEKVYAHHNSRNNNPGKRRSGFNHPVDIVYDEKEEMKETVRAEVKQEFERKRMEELTRENERLKQERSRFRRGSAYMDPPEPIMNGRERFPWGSAYKPLQAELSQAELPRSRRAANDLQSHRRPY